MLYKHKHLYSSQIWCQHCRVTVKTHKVRNYCELNHILFGIETQIKTPNKFVEFRVKIARHFFQKNDKITPGATFCHTLCSSLQNRISHLGVFADSSEIVQNFYMTFCTKIFEIFHLRLRGKLNLTDFDDVCSMIFAHSKLCALKSNCYIKINVKTPRFKYVNES